MKRLSAAPLAFLRTLFVLALLVTLVCLLAPAEAVLAAKVWTASWLPMASAIEAMDASAYSDKLAHASLFAVLGWLAARSWLLPRHRWYALAGLLLVGALTEWLQAFVPGRSASLGDWVADALGLCAGLLLWPAAPVQRQGVSGAGTAAGRRAAVWEGR